MSRLNPKLHLEDAGKKLEGYGPKDERATVVVEASVANFNFIFEISNLNYLGIYTIAHPLVH